MLAKDFRTEARSRYALYTMLLFCLTTLAVVSFATGGATGGPGIQAALLWTILFFTAMTGLSRCFIKEEERGTLTLLRCVARPGPLFVGKAVFNLLLIETAAVILCPLFCVLLDVHPGNVALLAAVVFAASLSLAVLCTMVSALVSQSRAKGTLFPVLAFPLLSPPFAVAVRATEAALRGESIAAQASSLVFLLSFAIVGFVVSLFLFELVFED